MPEVHTEIRDLRSTIVPKSDQLNSEQLLGGPMIITVTDVRVGAGEEQPVAVYHESMPDRPFKPCKTMRKVLILAWGADGTQWIGRSMELFCDSSVKFGGKEVGGIRISRLSDIPRDIKVSLTATKGRKDLHEIRPLTASPELTKVLAAITAATGRDSMDKARKLAEELFTDADIALARTAYAKKVKELKAAGAKPAAPVIPDDDTHLTAEQVEANIRAATTTDILDMAIEQIASVEDEAARIRLAEIAYQRHQELAANG